MAGVANKQIAERGVIVQNLGLANVNGIPRSDSSVSLGVNLLGGR